MSTTINFDDLPQGTIPTNEYADKGILFTRTDVVSSNPEATSPSNVLHSFNTHSPAEFPETHIDATFVVPTHSHISMRVGRDNGLSSDFFGHLNIFDNIGTKIGSPIISMDPGVQLAFVEFYAGDANIASFQVVTTTTAYWIDDLQFDDTSVVQQPDFQLLF